MRIATVLGARPQFIKASVVSRALAARPGIEEKLIHTGQHYDANLSDVFFHELGIPGPSLRLDVGSASDVVQTARIMEALDGVLSDLQPDLVLVYGDTNSTLAGALGAAKRHVRVAHVEAGLRSFNRRMQEEINRVVTDHLSEVLFAPTAAAQANLRGEGVAAAKIHVVGDVMYDVALRHRDAALRDSSIARRLGLGSRPFVLATVHRAENADDPLRLGAILGGLAMMSRDHDVVLPLHPRTRKAVEADPALRELVQPLLVTEPLGYLDIVALEARAAVIATDSGGMQKEAYFHRVPCVTLRDETEWQELVDLGWNRVCAPRNADVVAGAIRAAVSQRGSESGSPYGDGNAAERIAAVLAG
jgi:UDP-GlcNAc3NAcA epimerase